MSYVDGFVMAVPDESRTTFIEHARIFDSMLLEHGALRVVECWGENVPEGKPTDFRQAVQARPGESVVFSWIEWPDKATRDAAHVRLEELMRSGMLDPVLLQPPFDGKRMIYGGFEPILELGGTR